MRVILKRPFFDGRESYPASARGTIFPDDYDVTKLPKDAIVAEGPAPAEEDSKPKPVALSSVSAAPSKEVNLARKLGQKLD